MTYDDRPDPAKRLEAARIAKGFPTPKDAARAFGWSYETYYQHETGMRGLTRAVSKYAKAYGVSESWILFGDGAEPEKVKKDGLTRANVSFGNVKVIGKVAASTWMDVDEMDFGFDSIEPVPSASGYDQNLQFALIVDGNCLNKVAQDGSILVCVTTAAGGVDVKQDDLVVVERRRFGGQMVQRTAKRVRQTANGFELWPESTEPDHQEPIRLYGDHDGEEIEVIGKVLWILRKP